MSELQALLDAAVDAIIVIDAHGAIVTFNAAAERMFGYAAADALGKPVGIVMPEPQRTEHQGHIERYLATRVPHIIGIGREVVGRRANGETFPIALSVGESGEGDSRRFVGIARDASGQHAADQRARALEARLARVARFGLMGEMTAGMAHEMNQPLSAIATYAQAARRIVERQQPETKALIDVCEKIDEQALRAGRVIENLRKFLKKQDTQTEIVDVNAVVDDAMPLVDADAHAEGIRISARYEKGLETVCCNVVQLQQVLLNLTRNAVDAMRESPAKSNGIEIVTSRGGSGGVTISVTDHGPGVSPQLGDNIFHPFVTTKRDGLGVSLAVSRTIVQSWGGTLTYNDNPRGGAIFSISLPAAKERPLEQSQDVVLER